MIFYLVDAALVVALLIACLRVLTMHRALGQLRVYHQDYQAALEKTAAALAAVRVVLSERNSDGFELSTRLSALIAEARTTIDEIDARLPQLESEGSRMNERHATPVEENAYEDPVIMPAVVAGSHSAFAFCRRVARPMVEALADG